MILFKFTEWTVKETSKHKEFNLYHTCKPAIYRTRKDWGTLYKKTDCYMFRSTNCGRCAEKIPQEVLFLLEMI